MSAAPPSEQGEALRQNLEKLYKRFSNHVIKVRTKCGTHLALLPRKPLPGEWNLLQGNMENRPEGEEKNAEAEERKSLIDNVKSRISRETDGEGLTSTRKARAQAEENNTNMWSDEITYPYLEYDHYWITTEDFTPDENDPTNHIPHDYNCVGYTLNDKNLYEEEENIEKLSQKYVDLGYIRLDPEHKDATIDLWFSENHIFAHATKKYTGPMTDVEGGQLPKDLWEGFTSPSPCFTHRRFAIANSIRYCYVGASFRAPTPGEESYIKYMAHKGKQRDEDVWIYPESLTPDKPASRRR